MVVEVGEEEVAILLEKVVVLLEEGDVLEQVLDFALGVLFLLLKRKGFYSIINEKN